LVDLAWPSKSSDVVIGYLRMFPAMQNDAAFMPTDRSLESSMLRLLLSTRGNKLSLPGIEHAQTPCRQEATGFHDDAFMPTDVTKQLASVLILQAFGSSRTF
jgi:hypothetical protein